MELVLVLISKNKYGMSADRRFSRNYEPVCTADGRISRMKCSVDRKLTYLALLELVNVAVTVGRERE